MSNTDLIVKRFCEEPILFTGCFTLLLLTTGILLIFVLKQIENPIKQVFIYLGKFFNQAFLEISGKAGWAGTADLVIVVCMFILAFSIINSSSIAGALGVSPEESSSYFVILAIGAGVIFIASLGMSIAHDKFVRLSKL